MRGKTQASSTVSSGSKERQAEQPRSCKTLGFISPKTSRFSHLRGLRFTSNTDFPQYPPRHIACSCLLRIRHSENRIADWNILWEAANSKAKNWTEIIKAMKEYFAEEMLKIG
jgi:hypothetical protein